MFFWWARVCWPLLCLCRPFCIFERCLDSDPESCRSKQARCQHSHPLPQISHPSPTNFMHSHVFCDRMATEMTGFRELDSIMLPEKALRSPGPSPVGQQRSPAGQEIIPEPSPAGLQRSPGWRQFSPSESPHGKSPR